MEGFLYIFLLILHLNVKNFEKSIFFGEKFMEICHKKDHFSNI